VKISTLIERLQTMQENKGDVEVLIAKLNGLYDIKRIDSANHGMTGNGFVFIQQGGLNG
jgi:hypothetical protein